ncbi:MAG TPA: ABC transporter ATP-binding protein [Humisphaera sp.]|nr:ABC transporter ATP-binding protein [Humisphaera sp.]
MSTIALNRSRKKPARPGLSIPLPPLGEEEEQRYRPIDRVLLRRVLGLLVPFKKKYALGVALGASMTILEMFSPKFMQWIIDYGVSFQKHVLPGNPTTKHAIGHVLLTIGAWALCLSGAIVLQRFTIIVMTAAGERVQFSLRQRLFEQLQRLSMAYYDRTKLGRIISRCTSDISAMREINVWGMHVIVTNLLMMIVAGIMLATATDVRLFLSVAWLGLILIWANRIYLRRAAAQWQIVREGWTRVSTNMAENITGMRVVTAFNRQIPNLGVFDRLQENNTSNNVTMARINGLYQPVLDLIRFAGKIIILVYGAYLLVSGKFAVGKGVGAVVAATLYWDWFMNPITTFGQWYNMLMQAMASAERVFSLLDLKPDVQDVSQAKPLGRIVGHVMFDHVTFGYKEDRPVLHDVCFDAAPGQMIALVGATGSGKSSIISLIARFYQPQQGRILVDGQDIRLVSGDSLHRQTGLVLQQNYLFTGSVMDNIRYAKPQASDEEVINAAKAIGAHDMISSLQNGYQCDVGERGANMSLGQRQLICFARAFLADPRIFMLDEATSAVDTATELLVQRSLEKLLAGRTTFVVAHRLSTILKANCILVIDQGKIIERGTHRELLARGGKYAHLYEQFVHHSE